MTRRRYAMMTLLLVGAGAGGQVAAQPMEPCADAPARSCAGLTLEERGCPICPDDAPQRRELSGHVFNPSRLVLDPFAASYAARYVGVGLGRISGATPNGLDETHYTAHAIATGGSFQWGLTDWFALRFETSIIALYGAHDVGALMTGETVQYTVGGGITLGTRLSKIVQVAATLDVAYAPVTSLDILHVVQASVAEGRVDPRGLTMTDQQATIVPGIAVAVAPMPAFGVIANIQSLHSFAETGALRSNTDGLAFAVLGDLDLRHLTRLPVGVNLSYRVIVPVGRNEAGVEQDLDPAVYLLLHPRVVVGVEVPLRWFRPTPARTGFAALPQFVLRYYW